MNVIPPAMKFAAAMQFKSKEKFITDK